MADQKVVAPEGAQNTEVNVRDTLQPWETSLRGPEGVSLESALFGGWESAEDNPETDGVLEAEAESEEDEETVDEALEVEEEADESEDSEDEPEADGESDEGEEQEDSDTEALYKVVLPGGEEAEVTLEELTKGYSRQADYTRKTQETAAIRKEAVEKRDQYLHGLKELEAVVAAVRPEEPDWQKLRAENPAEYAALREDFKQYEDRLAAVRRRVTEIEQEQQAEANKALEQYAQAEYERLLQVYPEWKDPSVRENARKELWEFAQEAYGLSPEELSQVVDHRLIRVLRDAHKGRSVEAKVKELPRKPVAGAKKVLKPGATNGRKGENKTSKTAKQRQAAATRWRQTGRAQDALSFFETFVDD